MGCVRQRRDCDHAIHDQKLIRHKIVRLMRVAWVSFDAIGRAALLAAASRGADVTAIVTLAGPVDPHRSGQCTFDDVAADLGAPLVKTDDVNAPETIHALRAADPAAIFVVGWSQLVREELIALAPEGVFGMHPTALPRHRGRAPIPWAILSGLARTAVTLFEIVDGTADSGPIVGQVEVTVAPDETATTLVDKVAKAHVDLIHEYFPLLAAGAAPRIEQDERRVSSWPRRTPSDGIIDWDTRAQYLYDWVRAQTRPYPGAFTYLGEEKLIVWRARPVPWDSSAPSGTVVADGPVVACGDGALLLEETEGPSPRIGAELG
jgi:methionyl-tRNA formyltransferase